MVKRLSKKEKREEVLSRMNELFARARQNPSSGTEYVRKARRIGMKVQMPLPRNLKRQFCKHCYIYFTSSNLRVRTREKYVVYYCLTCKKFMRFVK